MYVDAVTTVAWVVFANLVSGTVRKDYETSDRVGSWDPGDPDG